MPALLTRADLLGKDEYERVRDQFRREILQQKRPRRVLLGSNCSVHFENREIMRYQIMEMLRCENTFDNDDAIEDELRAYNPLITQPDLLSATFMFEYPTEDERQTELRKLVGIDQHIWLQIEAEPRVGGQFDRHQLRGDKISSVQFVKFPLTESLRQKIATPGTAVRLLINHPYYSAVAVLGEETRASLAADLAE